MNYFDSNIRILQEKELPDFIRPLEEDENPLSYIGQDIDNVKVFLSPEMGPIAINNEIDKNNLPNKSLKQIVFFFGIASLQELIEVSRYAHPESLFVIIEPIPFFLVHALNDEDFSLLVKINYILVTEKSTNIGELLAFIFSSQLFLLAKKPIFYLNSYYRQFDAGIIKGYIKAISGEIHHRYFTIGNSIQDSLIGLVNNLQNIDRITRNPNVSSMKNLFKGRPAFIVSAGPSLDRNIDELKRIGNSAVIIAVDTIAERLINKGIIPHFICTVERESIVWDYFYEKQEYPSELYLVAPPVVDPRITQKFSNRAILPMRETVREYKWFSDILGLCQDDFVWMGGSCAHLAFGIAIHFGASPIVLLGQDLAFGIGKSHADGTIYENKPVGSGESELFVPGYYGAQVPTRKVWFEFKLLFEKKIELIDNKVINATEGGAKIEGTLQQPLKEVIDQYCNDKIDVSEILRGLPQNSIDILKAENKLQGYLKSLGKCRNKTSNHLDKLVKIIDYEWSNDLTSQQVDNIYKIMKKTDAFLQEIRRDELLHHNIQGPLAVLMQKFYSIEQNDSLDSLKKNLEIQIELCKMVENTAWLIEQVIVENFPFEFNE